MRLSIYIATGVTALMLASAGAQASVRVTFVDPAKYHDEDFRNAASRKDVIAEFRKFFDRLGERYLKDSQTLRIDVLDADLAGRYEPWQPEFQNVRILRDVTPPRFKLRYTLNQGRTVLMSGEETVTDNFYLWNPSARASSERFVYEKDMLRDWFRKRFVRHMAPRT